MSQDSIVCILFYLFFLFNFVFLGPRPWHIEILRLRVESELQLPAYTTATSTPDLDNACGLHQRSWQCQILNPLSKARSQTSILMDTSQVRYCWATVGTPHLSLSFNKKLCSSDAKRPVFQGTELEHLPSRDKEIRFQKGYRKRFYMASPQLLAPSVQPLSCFRVICY